MNIDKLIFPRFKRFETMNLGLKRMLFVLTFFPLLFLVGAIICVMYYENRKGIDAISAFAICFAIYIGFWIICRGRWFGGGMAGGA